MMLLHNYMSKIFRLYCWSKDMIYIPCVATSLRGFCVFSAIYPKTEKMTNPDKKLVAQLIELVAKASLKVEIRKCLKMW